MVQVELSLQEILEQLKELSDKGIHDGEAFNEMLNEYHEAVVHADRAELHEARNYLSKVKTIGKLKVGDMVENLECA